jgi:glucosamine--fructose-6-phosphate aminotransferase (isomerizing)
MCGIVGYIGTTSRALTAVTDGLSALEYRGYDSAGVCFPAKDKLETIKQAGTVDGVVAQLTFQHTPKQTMAIGHTRWATHGEPTADNAHPHTNAARSIAVVHNGIIENYQAIRELLQANGYVFRSETDTEVIPHLIDYHLRSHDTFLDAFMQTLHELRGAYAIAAINHAEPDTIYAAKLSSPLVIGVSKTAHILASDAMAILPHTDQLIQLEDYEVAVLTPKTRHIIDSTTRTKRDRQSTRFEHSLEAADLAGYPDYMSKEIHQAADTVRTATRGRLRARGNIVKLGGLEIVSQQLRYIDRIVIVACGTSYYAGMVGEYLIEQIAGIPVEVQLASEFKYRHEPFSRSTALLAISQSGETADTIAALKKVENYGVLRLGVVNAPGSTIAQMTDAGVYCHAGPEKSVASTKAFMAQVTVLAEIALHLSDGRSPHYKPLIQELLALPDKIDEVLAQEEHIAQIARRYAGCRDFLYIGRGEQYPGALEGALKLKEISYIHAEGYAAGEMKHGPLAMIDADFPTLALATNSAQLDKTMSNIEEIRARKGKVIAVATSGNTAIKRLATDVIYVPDTLEQTAPLLTAVALQLFAYHVARAKGLNVDRPRNLAKSVTVE